MKQLIRRSLALGVVGALMLAPVAVAAQEQPTDELQAALDVVLERVQELADEAGIDVDDVLGAELPFGSDEHGEGGEGPTATIEEILEGLVGGSLIDEENNSGFAGTPWTNAGNIMHVAANLSLELVTVPRTETDPNVVDVHPYSVVESDYSPDTPIAPVINPLLLAGAAGDVPVEDPLNLPLLLATHWGGKLKNVQGGDWDVLGAHSAGSHLIGTNLDTAERPEGDEATFPFYAPVMDEGVLLLPDESIDFLGFETVVNTSDCTRIPVLNIPFTENMVAADTCVGVGVILGDGVSFFNGEGPVDFRTDLAPLWEPAPDEFLEVMAAIDEVIAQIPVDEVLEQVLELVGGVDLPDADDPVPGDDDDDDDEEEDGLPLPGEVRRLLGGLNRFIP